MGHLYQVSILSLILKKCLKPSDLKVIETEAHFLWPFLTLGCQNVVRTLDVTVLKGYMTILFKATVLQDNFNHSLLQTT